MSQSMRTRKKAEEPTNTKLRVPNLNLLDLYSACLQNANELIEEADLLLNNGHYCRAYFLAFTAFEELGKSQVVADYFNEMVSKEEFKTAFSDHQIKTAYIKRFVQIPKDLNGDWFIEYNTQSTRQYSKARTASLYINYSPDYKPQFPTQTISIESTNELIFNVKKYLVEIIKTAHFTERIGTKAFTK